MFKNKRAFAAAFAVTGALMPFLPSYGGDFQKTSVTGAVFTWDISIPALGFLTWREPDHKNGDAGMLWGDVLRTSDGSIRYMSFREAYEHCLSLNPAKEKARIRASLKRGEEPSNAIFLPLQKSFRRLAIHLGSQSAPKSKYTPGVLPSLTRAEDGRIVGNQFWAIHSKASFASVFDGANGSFRIDSPRIFENIATRCVGKR